jgi:predicted O-methyltransferase YrrM
MIKIEEACELLKNTTPPKASLTNLGNLFGTSNNFHDNFHFHVPFVCNYTGFVLDPKYIFNFSVLWDFFKPIKYLVIGALLGTSESYACWRTKHHPSLIVVADIDLAGYNPNRSNMASQYINITAHYPNELILMRSNSQTSNSCRAHGPYDLIFVDGEHSRKGVYKDIQHAWSQLTEDGVIMVHDVDLIPGVSKGYNDWLRAAGDQAEHVTIPNEYFQQGLGLIQRKRKD